MGNQQSLERDQSIRIANQTEIPLVYAISQTGPLYWGVLQPGERVTRHTGRVWFTVTCYPYTGSNEPTNTEAVLGILIPTAAVLVVAATGGVAYALAAPASLTAASAFAPLVPFTQSAAVVAAIETAGVASVAYTTQQSVREHFVKSVARAAHKVEVMGHFANGDWLHVRGGIQKGVDHSAWQPMRFER